MLVATTAFGERVGGGASGGGSGGLGGAFPAHYGAVTNTLRLNENTKWSDIQGTHLRQLTDAMGARTELSKTSKQQIVEVLFKAVVFNGKNFDGVDKENVFRFWDNFLRSDLNQRMPNEAACRTGIQKGIEADVLKGCGLSYLGVTLAPQGSWLDGLDVQPAETWEKVTYKGKPLSEMSAEQTTTLLRSAYARLAPRDTPMFMFALERDYLIQFAFKRVLYYKNGLSPSEREKIASEWVQNLMVRARIILTTEAECRSAFAEPNPERADKSCGFANFSFKTIVHAK